MPPGSSIKLTVTDFNGDTSTALSVNRWSHGIRTCPFTGKDKVIMPPIMKAIGIQDPQVLYPENQKDIWKIRDDKGKKILMIRKKISEKQNEKHRIKEDQGWSRTGQGHGGSSFQHF